MRCLIKFDQLKHNCPIETNNALEGKTMTDAQDILETAKSVTGARIQARMLSNQIIDAEDGSRIYLLKDGSRFVVDGEGYMLAE